VTVTPAGLVRRLRQPASLLRRGRALKAAAEPLAGAVALEPGGPSALFGARGLVPVYPLLATLDTLDYAQRTLWSAQQQASGERQPRRRLVGEAGELAGVAPGSYDALLASHVLEHLANPLGALRTWSRAVRLGGHLLLVVPHRDGTFDHRRPVTPLAHMREDERRGTAEDDLTHLDEVLRLHDLARDPGAPSREVFEQRCRENARTRGMHHHVFVSRSVIELCRAAALTMELIAPRLPFDIVCLCGVAPDAGDGLSGGLGEEQIAQALRRSPFPSDRLA